MYNVIKENHKKYGDTISIVIEDHGKYGTPFQALDQVKLQKRLLLESGCEKVKILINKQILTIKQAEKWCSEEYKSLPKCFNCARILHENVFTHRLCKSNLFCTEECSNRDLNKELEKLLDEEEIDYL